MKSISRIFLRPRCASFVIVALTALALLPFGASAQNPPVPAAFQDVYTLLSTDLSTFNTTLNAGPPTQYPTVYAANVKNADGNAGPGLINPGAFVGIQLQIQEIQAMGAKAAMISVGFPVLYEPFLTSQGQSYSQFLSFYQQVAAAVRTAGLKLIIENNTLLTDDAQAGWNPTSFYATLNWTQYQQARAQMAVTIAQALRPDYMVLVEEPVTEAHTSGQTQANTATGSGALLSQMLTSVQQAGVSGMKVGAGTGTTQTNYLSFIQQYVALPVDFIDMHIYPINRSYLSNAVQIANTAAAAGKPVAMTECWMWKIRDTELATMGPSAVRARNPFSFWAPLDANFLQTMGNLANHTQMLFMAPMGTDNFAAYLPYDSTTMNLSPTDILSQQSAQASTNLNAAIYTSTAVSYHDSMVSPPDKVAPTVPQGVSGASANPTTATLNWNASTDNVGVAGYNILRNGSLIDTTANLYYQDTNLVESTTYTYTVQAFDLGGNTSASSLRANVTTGDDTAPTAPTNLVPTALAFDRVSLSWSPSTDAVGVNTYQIFWGTSAGALQQNGRTYGTVTTYNCTGLTAGTTYYFGVEAVDKSGNTSPMSQIVSLKTPNLPGAPSGLAATANSASKITLTWSASASGGLPVQYYHVMRGSSPSNLTQVGVLTGTSYPDTTVNPSTKYYYAVQAGDIGGDLSPMSLVVAITSPGLPSAPTNLVATPISTARVSLTWSAAVSGGLPIQNYHVFRGSSPSTLGQLDVVLQPSYNDVTVTAGATYYYAVQAADSGADQSPMSVSVRVVVPKAPSAPANLVATPVSTTKIGLTWSASVSGGLTVQYYHVFRGTSSASMPQIATITQTSYTDTPGAPATKYYYAVQAVDSGGDLSPMSATISATTMALPSAPTKLIVAAISKTQISLSWTAGPSGMPVSSFHVFRGSSTANLAPLKQTAAGTTSITDSPVTAGTTYYYGVQETDTGGNVSPMSTVVSVTTPTK